MRNLKRALSLALATVMTVGMMVVGAGASYADVKATDNVEAIEVLQAVGIMTGDEKGNFNPDANVTRNEIAVIMSNLLNLDYDYYRGTNPFTDVPSWAAPYVAACYAEGVVAGIGGTLYGGSNNVTAAEASLMIMKALGYFQYQNDFGDDWQIATIRQASYINLFDGINANAETALTRNQIAQLVLNGLKANMVTFTGSVGAQIGDVSVGYVPEYTAITNANKKYDSIDVGTTNIGKDDQYYVQLGEELYNGDLKLTATTDVFGRPAYTWEYKSTEIGTYMDDSQMLQEYTVKVTGDMLYDLLTRNTVNTYDLTVVIDGVYEEDAPNVNGVPARWFEKKDINRNNDQGLGGTGNGVLTQVFVDNDAKMITVTVINTYLALANKDYDSKKDEIGFDVYGIAKTPSDVYYKFQDADVEDMVPMKVSGEDFAIENMAEKDAVLVTVADGEIQTMADCEIMAGVTVDAFETDYNEDGHNNVTLQGTPSLVEVDGTEYKFSSAAEFDHEVLQYYTTSGNGVTNLKDKTYNLYMDAYGYVIGVEEVEVANNYVFLTGLDVDSTVLGSTTAKANAIFLDGRMETISINMSKSNIPDAIDAILNTWCTYTVNTNNVYTVKQVADAGSTKYTNDANVPGGANNDTKLAQFNAQIQEDPATTDPEVIKVNSRNIFVQGGGAATTYSRVYGTDNTVYLTVGVKELRDGANYFGYINEVKSVVTGIDNANLEAWSDVKAAEEAEKEYDPNGNPTGHLTPAATLDNATDGVFALYNDKGDIIAAVVVGEDVGLTKNMVYTHEASTFRETYNSTTKQWTWSRKVISNGQEIVLTEVGDGTSELVSMEQDTWYQVKYNAEGNVVSVQRYDFALDKGSEWYDDIDTLSYYTSKNDTVLYYSTGTGNLIDSDDVKLIGKTLFLNDTANGGFRVAEDVNIALIQWNNNHVRKTYFETGVTSLKNIINELNDRHDSDPHNYVVSAMLEKNVATSIVIYDNCDPYQDGDWDNNKSGKLDLGGLSFSDNAAIGLRVNYQNKSGDNITLNGTTVITVRVKDAETGKLLFAGPASATLASNGITPITTIANNGYGVMQFGFNTIPGGRTDYNVELTIVDGVTGTTYTGTATLATA